MSLKHTLARWLQRFPPLRWALRLAVRLLVPRHHVGAVGVVFNDAGQILLVEHVFRPNFPWGLPGGWIEAGEDPAAAVRRELEEELQLQVEVKRLLLCKSQGVRRSEGVPRGLGLVFYCRLIDSHPISPNTVQDQHTYEILSTEWVAPDEIRRKLTPLEAQAIPLAQEEFEREQRQLVT